MILIDGKKAAAELREELKQEVAELKTKHDQLPLYYYALIQRIQHNLLNQIQRRQMKKRLASFFLNYFEISIKYSPTVYYSMFTIVVFFI